MPNGSPERTLTIDGLRPERWLEPASAAELASMLAEAADADVVTAPVGGGTSLALGNVPERLDLAISTARLNQILDYAPTDLTLSVGAGARFADVQATLEAEGQTLPLDVAHPDRATIGGLIATAISGPRRLGSGTLRDLLIGAEVALPNGTLAKAGGMVVKNVTGFDLSRLYHGSLGTLGVLVSANFKVLPLARSEATIVAVEESLDAALDLAQKIRAQRLQPIALEVFSQNSGWAVAARFAGRERAVEQRLSSVAGLRDGQHLEQGASRDWWQHYMDAQALDTIADDEVLVRWSVRPSETAGLAYRIMQELNGESSELVWLGVSIGLGTVIGSLRVAPSGDGARSPLDQQRQWQALADHVQILAAAPTWKRDIDVWGEEPETLDLMRELKTQFDPGRTLNRGRFVGRI